MSVSSPTLLSINSSWQLVRPTNSHRPSEYLSRLFRLYYIETYRFTSPNARIGDKLRIKYPGGAKVNFEMRDVLNQDTNSGSCDQSICLKRSRILLSYFQSPLSTHNSDHDISFNSTISKETSAEIQSLDNAFLDKWSSTLRNMFTHIVTKISLVMTNPIVHLAKHCFKSHNDALEVLGFLLIKTAITLEKTCTLRRTMPSYFISNQFAVKVVSEADQFGPASDNAHALRRMIKATQRAEAHQQRHEIHRTHALNWYIESQKHPFDGNYNGLISIATETHAAAEWVIASCQKTPVMMEPKPTIEQQHLAELMQDSWRITELDKLSINNGFKPHISIVADGHGKFGSSISSYVVETFPERLVNQLKQYDNIKNLSNPEQVERIIYNALRKTVFSLSDAKKDTPIYSAAKQDYVYKHQDFLNTLSQQVNEKKVIIPDLTMDEAMKTSGSTMNAVLRLNEKDLYVANIGDSSAALVVIHKNDSGDYQSTIIQLSEPQDVYSDIKASGGRLGYFETGDASGNSYYLHEAYNSYRFYTQGKITLAMPRAIGDFDVNPSHKCKVSKVDLSEVRKHSIPESTIDATMYLLQASDGPDKVLGSMIGTAEVFAHLIKQGDHPEQACKKIIACARRENVNTDDIVVLASKLDTA